MRTFSIKDTLDYRFTTIQNDVNRSSSLNFIPEYKEENEETLIDYESMKESDILKKRALKIQNINQEDLWI